MRIVKLPSGYKQVEYIQSTGTQYIDTGFKPNGNTRVVMDFQFLSTPSANAALFGSRTGSTTACYIFMWHNSGYFRSDYNTGVTQKWTVDVLGRRTVDKNKETTTIDGTSNSYANASFNGTYNMLLFGSDNAGTVAWLSSVRLYSCQIYDNGVLVRDFIPCKTTANVAGLYDLVEGKFYGNAGTGEFLYGAPVKLPNGYRRLTYIESSGTQYIDTGFKPNQDTKVVMDVQMASQENNQETIFGARTSSSSKAYGNNILAASYRLFYNSGYSDMAIEFTLTDRHTVVQDKNTMTIGDYSISRAYAAFQCDYNMYLFAMNQTDAARFFARAKVYSCQVHDNGTLVRDFVPCINSAGEVGLYDDVYGVFYGNSGTGTFVAGQKLYAEEDITKLEYIQSTGTQYVDTGFVPNQDTGVTIDFQLNSVSGWQCVFGARTGNNTKSYSLWHSGTAFGFYYANANTTFSNLDGTARHTVNATKNTATADGANSVSLGYSTFAADYSMCLFAVNSDGAAQSNASMKLFACQIYDNGVLARDFIPGEIDGVVGLWDAISGVLYENAGSGNFVAGPVIYEGLPAPGNLTAEVTEIGVILRWETVETALGYRVYRDYLFLTETAENEYTDSDTQNWEQYTYSVSAFDETEEGAAASVAVVLTSDNPILDLITDRTADDVNRVVELSEKDFVSEMTGEERKEFLRSMKGAYNASDLNRVGAAIRYVADRINGYGTLVKVSPKTDWVKNDIPTPEQLTDYLTEISTVRGALAVMKNTPAVPGDMENFTYNEANNIEQILLDVDLLITNMTLAWFYCGEVYSGEV